VVAVHSAAGKRPCGGDDVAPGQQMRGPGVTIITFAAVVADGLPQGGVAASITSPYARESEATGSGPAIVR
jgi:hypothetical protein